MSASPNIRKANDLDIPSINKILRISKAYWGYDEAFMDAFMQKFAISNNYLEHNNVYVMTENDHIVGFFSFVFHEDHSLELDHFFISTDYMGQGFGKKLWNACITVADDLGAKEFTLWADPEAEAFYKKMGCETIGVKKSPFMADRYPPIMKFVLKETK